MVIHEFMEKTVGESTKNTSCGVSVVALKSRLASAMALEKKEVRKICQSRDTQILVSKHNDDEKVQKGFMAKGHDTKITIMECHGTGQCSRKNISECRGIGSECHDALVENFG